MSFLTIIALVVIIAIPIILHKVLKEKIRRSHLICKECKQVYDEDDIDWEEVKTYTKVTNSNSSTRRDEYSTVEFVCTCHNCNTVKKFKHDFLIYSYYYGDRGPSERTYELEPQIDKYLNLKFKDKYNAKQLQKAEKEMQTIQGNDALDSAPEKDLNSVENNDNTITLQKSEIGIQNIQTQTSKNTINIPQTRNSNSLLLIAIVLSVVTWIMSITLMFGINWDVMIEVTGIKFSVVMIIKCICILVSISSLPYTIVFTLSYKNIASVKTTLSAGIASVITGNVLAGIYAIVWASKNSNKGK